MATPSIRVNHTQKCTAVATDSIHQYAGGSGPRTVRPVATEKPMARSPQKAAEQSEVHVSAVISTYLLTHLHHVLQRAEYGAVQDGRRSQAANYAQLRKVLCMEARSMEDASASGLKATEFDQAA